MEPKAALANNQQNQEYRAESRSEITVAGLFAGTTVLTLDGALPVEHLNPGDRIITRTGSAILRALGVRVGPVTPCKITSSALGGGRPDHDILLPAGQNILVRDWRAKALFGSEQVTAPIAKIADGEYISLQPVAKMRMFSLVFDDPQVFYASGLELVSATETNVQTA